MTLIKDPLSPENAEKLEEAAAAGTEAETTEVKVIEIKNDHTNWKKIDG